LVKVIIMFQFHLFLSQISHFKFHRVCGVAEEHSFLLFSLRTSQKRKVSWGPIFLKESNCFLENFGKEQIKFEKLGKKSLIWLTQITHMRQNIKDSSFKWKIVISHNT
jgi:hypothetical protein